ncbi:MAG: Na+/H+ antiporter NhaC family protein [Planctomycetes bacterium]|nr:Na+/H+ antiporter NhaC family protein [Planctomycetota bacterium]
MAWLGQIWDAMFPPGSYGCLSLLPPLIAITLAIVTRRVVVSLFAGVAVGGLILSAGNPFAAIESTLETHLWTSLSDNDHLRVFVFTLLMGATVGVMRKSGGMEAIVNGIAPLARSRRGGQLTVWLLGLIVFFDDYANSLLLGNTMRPLTDRLRISREKLAYLVDSTAAPVSGLALVSTWVAGEIGYIQDGLDGTSLAESASAFEIFVATIPYRFYVLWALLMVPLVGLLGRDFGSMLVAERNAVNARPSPTKKLNGKQSSSSQWPNAVAPVLTVVVVTVALIATTGWRTMVDDAATDRSLLNIFGNGNSYLALVYGSLAGFLIALMLGWTNAKIDLVSLKSSAIEGATQVVPALIILWLAWALSGTTKEEYLGTGQFLGDLLADSADVRWMPTIVFLLASVVAFSTGTSWGTMGILMPLVVPTTVQLLAANHVSVSPHDPLLIGSIGGVLAGAIFGDHCSPISDTTVLSSQASGCDHIAHVRTQMPYALLVAVISVACGTIPIGFGISVWFVLPAGVAVMVIYLLVVGKRCEAAEGEV